MSSSSPSPAAAPIFSPVAPVTPAAIPPSTAVPHRRPFSPPAPTPPSNLSPPPPPPPPPNHSTSRSVSTPVVTGIAVGSVALLVLLCLLWICCKKKKRRPLAAFDYYGGHPPPPQPMKDDAYDHSAQKWPPPHHRAKGLPQPSPPLPFASHPPNPISKFPPPPPRPVNSSTGGSGSISSRTDPLVGFSRSAFMFEELAGATDQFSDTNLLGQGGFGYVHRGVLPNGKEVAIKQLKTGSSQGEREFQAEVEIISRVHHKHLVSLIGYCISDEQRLLVYEYVPNKTLEFHLHGKGQATMGWPTRLKIAMGSAKGLAYLHEDCHPNIIHRDIKAANILLDLSFEAKVADFGLAKFTSDNSSHVSTRVMGTFGYLAPEYASTGKLTDKSDVFSFGVMLLELITGKRPVDQTYSLTDESLVDWARPLMEQALVDGDYANLIDPKLGNHYNRDEMARMIACAAACVRHSAKRRPSMALIVRALQGGVSLEYANEGGVKPENSSRTSYSSSDNESIQYIQYMKKFKKIAANRDSSSGKYSAPTSEYSLNTSSSTEGEQAVKVEMSKMNN